MVGLLRYADLDGEADPNSFIGSPFKTDFKEIRDVAAWSHDAGVPQAAVRSAISAAIKVGLLERRRHLVGSLDDEPCRTTDKGCRTVYQFPERRLPPR
jgi:hypothetical protein